MRSFIQNLPHPIANTLFMLRRLRTSFYEDGLLTTTNADFRTTEHFKRVYGAAKATGSFGRWHVRWRIHVLCWAANHAASLEGDFVECGTDRGGTAMAVITHTNFGRLRKRFWLLDTFNGFDPTQLTIEEKAHARYMDYADCFEQVKNSFAGLDYVQLVQGTVPETLEAVSSEKIAYLHLDMNCTAPEIAALEYFWPKIVPFGVVIMDDYGWPRHYQQKLGYDRFAEERGLQILRLATGGQAILIKPPA